MYSVVGVVAQRIGLRGPQCDENTEQEHALYTIALLS